MPPSMKDESCGGHVTDLPITATASGSLKPIVRQPDLHYCDTTLLHTSQIVEVALLMELIEDCTRSILHIVGSKHRYAIARQLLRERCATVMIFKGGNTGSNYATCQQWPSFDRKSGVAYGHRL